MKKPKVIEPRFRGDRGSKINNDDRHKLRLAAIRKMSRVLKNASAKVITKLVQDPVRNIVKTCGALIAGKYKAHQISRIYNHLISLEPGKSPTDFEWKIRPHEMPFGIFADTLVESLLKINSRNPSWKFLLCLASEEVFGDVIDLICEAHHSTGCRMDFAAVLDMVRDVSWQIDPSKVDIMACLLNVEETVMYTGYDPDTGQMRLGKEENVWGTDEHGPGLYIPWSSWANGDEFDRFMRLLQDAEPMIRIRR